MKHYFGHVQRLGFGTPSGLEKSDVENKDFQMAFEIFHIALETHYSASFLENKQKTSGLMVKKLWTVFDDKSILKSCPKFGEYRGPYIEKE